MKKVCVDESKCIGCGACVAIAPENFDFNEEGYSTVINDNTNEKVQDALEACPVFAITIEDNDKSGKECNCGENCECEDNCTCGDDCKCGDNCTWGDDCKCDDEHCCCHDCECHDETEETDEENEEEAA